MFVGVEVEVAVTTTFPRAASFAGFPFNPLIVNPYCTINPAGIAVVVVTENGWPLTRGTETFTSAL